MSEVKKGIAFSVVPNVVLSSHVVSTAWNRAFLCVTFLSFLDERRHHSKQDFIQSQTFFRIKCGRETSSAGLSFLRNPVFEVFEKLLRRAVSAHHMLHASHHARFRGISTSFKAEQRFTCS